MALAKHIEQAPQRPDRHIDYDRGVVIRKAQDLGIEVFMYKDEPGVFLSALGRPVAATLAKRAGYDIDALARLRQHRELLAVAARSIADRVGVAEPTSSGKTIKEIDGYKVVLLGMNRHVVVGPAGELLTEGVALDEKTALEVLKDVAEAASVPVDDRELGQLGTVGRQPALRPAEMNPSPKAAGIPGAPPPKHPTKIAP